MEKRILVVDDAMFMRKIIRKVLEEGGFSDILEAENGMAALKLFDEQKPDLVLLDITMPGMSGIEVLQEMKTRKPDCRVIMCSAVGQDTMICRAVEMGAADFIVKPFNKADFIKVVNHHLQ